MAIILCDVSDCIHHKQLGFIKQEFSNGFCGCDVIKIEQAPDKHKAHCDSYFITPESIKKHLKGGIKCQE